MFDEFLERKAPGFNPPKLHRKAVVHGHCHHKSVLKFEYQKSLLSKLGLEVEIPDSG